MEEMYMAIKNIQDGCAGMSAFQSDLLVVLADNEPCKGVTIMRDIENRYPTVTAGRLYPNLDELVAEGLVKKREKDGRTNEYAITDKGVRELNDYQKWLAGCMDDPDEKELVTDGGVVEQQQQQQQPSIEEAHAVSHARQTDNYHRIMMLVGSIGGAVIGMMPIAAHLGGAMTFEVAALFQVGFIAMCVSMGLSGVMLNE